MDLPYVCQLSIRHIPLSEHAQPPAGSDSRCVQLEAPPGAGAFLCWLCLIHKSSDALQSENP